MITPTCDTDTTMGNTTEDTQQQRYQQEQPHRNMEEAGGTVGNNTNSNNTNGSNNKVVTGHHHHHNTPTALSANNNNNNKLAIKNSTNTTSHYKRHRIRSRSMPNLIYHDPCSKIHKHQHQRSTGSNNELILNPKYLSTSNLPSPKNTNSNNNHQSIGPHTTTSPSKKQQHSGSSSKKSSHSPLLLPPSTSCPNAPIQPPPVNTQSLREIDLQEIFKNPQLRHDIIFDSQLQFRPNLDGERGKRKRLLAERYWDSVVSEFEFLSSSSSCDLKTNSKLPLLFHTLRDILLSLLPLKDRCYVDSILDPDLVIQQIRHCALDFLSLAQWLAEVFKAHCAPMRDSWVDQMVDRVELGIETKSARRLVEGLRMTFAILEAMKLDVANHQIRTLRPMLVDTAIDFEQDYYTQIIEKGKLNLNDSLDWYKDNLIKFKSSQFYDSNKHDDNNRLGFIYGLIKLLSCSSDDIVSEFPSSFGFDFSRLASFRAELRRVVCLHLCVCLYQQMLYSKTSGGNKDKIKLNLKKDKIQKFKHDLLAIIEDSVGNSKWTKNTQLLALEISKRVQLVLNKGDDEDDNSSNNITPNSELVDMAYGWLSKHLQPKSDIYKLLEQKTIGGLFEILSKSISVLSPLDSTNTCSTHGKNIPAINSSPVEGELLSLADRVLVLVRFHWGVFGKFYVTYLSLHHNDDTVKSTNNTNTANNSTCVLTTTTGNNSNEEEENEEDDEVKRQLAASQIRHQSSTSTC